MYRWLINTLKKHTQCSALLIIREQIKTTVRYNLKAIRMTVIKTSTNNNAGESVDKKETFCTIGGNAS